MKNCSMIYLYFQQDGATSHKGQANLNYLQEFRGERRELTLLGFFVFAHLKNKVFVNVLHIDIRFTKFTTVEVNNISPGILRNYKTKS